MLMSVNWALTCVITMLAVLIQRVAMSVRVRLDSLVMDSHVTVSELSVKF